MCCKKLCGITLTAVTALVLGCGQTNDKKADTAKPEAKKHAAAHEHGAGPHGGAVGEWGDGNYHVEFTVDHGKKEAIVYVLGGDGKTAAPVKASKLLLSINEPAFQVALAAKPLEGEPAGTSSRFVGEHENLGIVREFAGTISGEVDGKPFAGDFKEQP